MARAGRAWTREDEALLCEMRREGRTWRQIAGALRRSEAACANRHSEILTGKVRPGADRGRHDPWRPEEDAVLREAYRQPGGPNLLEVGRRIGRSEGACRTRAKILGIAAPRPSPQKIHGCAGARRCHDCGAPTFDYRCPACRKKWQLKHGVPLDVAARNSSGDE